MSEKSISYTVTGMDESTEQPIDLTFTVDYLEKENVYVLVDDGDGAIAIPNEDIRKVINFLNWNMVGGTP